MTAEKYANFPERDLKVVIGPHINATTTRLLGKLSIGAYEMTVNQQERAQASVEAGRLAMNALARELSMSVVSEESRDFLCCFVGSTTGHRFMLWITPPFESSQTNHLIWCKYEVPGEERKIGVSYRLATSFSVDDIVNQLKVAQRNAVVLAADEAFVLKGNPPPRFAKKSPATAETAAPAPAAAPLSDSPGT